MRNRPTRKAKAKEGAVVDNETGPRKSIIARKRKYEDRQIDEDKPEMETRQRRTRTSIETSTEEDKVRKSAEFLGSKRKSEGDQNDESSSKGDTSKRRRIQGPPSTSKLEKRVSKSKRKETFSDLFLTELDIKLNHKISLGSIHGISISDDNIWVNYLSMKHVKLLNSSGEELGCFNLDHSPVLSCCLPSGELLVTQGFAGGSKPRITSISREGSIKIFANLSSYAKHLFGILYKDEKIYVIGCNSSSKKGNHFVLRLNLIGEVEHVYNSSLSSENIKGLISLNGQIVGLRVQNSQMVALEKDGISSTVLNKVFNRNMYAASASVDNRGNVIIGTGTKLTFIDPSLENSHEINTGFSANIIATAVDRQDQLWIGTVDGELFAAKYLRD